MEKLTRDEVLKAYAEGRRDFSYCDLSEIDLSGANLSGIDLSRAILTHAKANGANLKNANFKEATLIGINASFAKFQGADLSDTDCSVSNFENADLSGANLSGANLRKSTLARSVSNEADFSCSNLAEAVLFAGNFKNSSFEYAFLKGANAGDAIFDDAKFNEANLQEVNFDFADMKGANLTDAKVKFATFLGTIEPDNLGKKEIFDAPQKVFVDMDGTLAEWRVIKSTDELYEKGYYSTLKPNKPILEQVKELTNDENVEVYILSSVLTDSEFALAEKNGWLENYFPEIDIDHRLFVPYGTAKLEWLETTHHILVRNEDVLIDDYSKNLHTWKEKGTGIKYMNGVNGNNGTWKGLSLGENTVQNLTATLEMIRSQEREREAEPLSYEYGKENQEFYEVRHFDGEVDMDKEVSKERQGYSSPSRGSDDLCL